MPSAVRTVHVAGESGTGKELVADLIEEQCHGLPFVRVNCGAIAASLMESELFGHAKGAFTGAVAEKRGWVEAASGGWLFLDEVAALSPSAQVALLRVIENGEFLRVGESKPRKVHVRIVSACHESLVGLVAEGKFRRDLWQRLREEEILLPPLRERPQEIPALVEHFCRTMDGGPYVVTPEALDVLCACQWKEGNVRELRNCLRAMTTLQVNRTLALASLPERVWERFNSEATPAGEGEFPSVTEKGSITLQVPEMLGPRDPVSFETLIDDLFVALLMRVLSVSKERLSLRAISQALSIPPTTVHRRLQKLMAQGRVSSEELGRISG